MKCSVLHLALVLTSTHAIAGEDSEYIRQGCWYYCDEGVVVRAMEDIVLLSHPPWQNQNPTKVGTVKKSEELLVIRAETKGTAARLKINKAKHGFVPTDDVWVFAYTAEGTWAIKHNGKTRE